MNKKIALITGVTGQDGSILAQFLLNKDYKVYGLIRYSSNINYENISHLLNNQNFHILYGDLADQNSLYRALIQSNPTEVYNLAAMSQVWQSFKIPQYTSNITGVGCLRMLQAIREFDVDKKIRYYQASSSEQFGKMVQNPANENTPFYPRSPYGVAKTYAHYMTKNYRESYGMFAVSGILFNHQQPLKRGQEFVTRKITCGIRDIIDGKITHIELGNIQSKRDWGLAQDYVQAMYLMLQQDKPQDYVVATNQTHSIKQFLKIAFQRANLGNYEKYIKINPKFFRPAEVDTLRGDYSKIKEKIGWYPKTSFKQLVCKMVDAQLKK